MSQILTLSGSPSATSRTTALLHHVGRRLTALGHDVHHLAVRDLPPGPLLAADRADAAMVEATAAIAQADAVVVGTPVYKAAYSGLLKTLLDVLPPTALADKTVLPLATGGTTNHLLAIDYALRPVLTALGTDSVLRGYFALDRHLTPSDEDGLTLSPEAVDGIEAAVQRLARSLTAPAADHELVNG